MLFIADVVVSGQVRNFVGCVRSVYVNNVNILQRLHRQSTATATHASISGSGDRWTGVDDTRVVYGDSGSALLLRRPKFGCHSLALSAVRLTRPRAILQLQHQTDSDSFNFRMSFATVKPDGVLLSTRVGDSSTHGVVQVSSYFSAVVFL